MRLVHEDSLERLTSRQPSCLTTLGMHRSKVKESSWQRGAGQVCPAVQTLQEAPKSLVTVLRHATGPGQRNEKK